ncbi:MAG: hypothetical protein QM817_34650 [Archangium sp.]
MTPNHFEADQLLALTPVRYLDAGYRDGAGLARPELSGLWSVAAALQLTQKRVSPAQLEQVLAVLAKAARTAAPRKTIQEALAALPPSAARDLVASCAAAVRDEADVPVMLQHLAAVLRVLALESVTTRE